MITWADVVAIDAALAGVPIATQNAILADVALQLSADTWDLKYDLASKYLAAHLGTVYLLTDPNSGGSSAGVKQEKVGDVSRTYQFPDNYRGDLQGTLWGQEFERLLRGLIGARMPLIA